MAVRDDTLLVGPQGLEAINAYITMETQRVFREHCDVALAPPDNLDNQALPRHNLAVIGTADSNPLIRDLVASGFLGPESRSQGHAMLCAASPYDQDRWLLAVAGADE